jgi:hypothetical protein
LAQAWELWKSGWPGARSAGRSAGLSDQLWAAMMEGSMAASWAVTKVAQTVGWRVPASVKTRAAHWVGCWDFRSVDSSV